MTSDKEAFDHLADSLAGKDVKFENGSVASYIDQFAAAIDNGDIAIGGGGGSSTVNVYFDPQTTSDNKTNVATEEWIEGLDEDSLHAVQPTDIVLSMPLYTSGGGRDIGYYTHVCTLKKYSVEVTTDNFYHWWKYTFSTDETSWLLCFAWNTQEQRMQCVYVTDGNNLMLIYGAFPQQNTGGGGNTGR